MKTPAPLSALVRLALALLALGSAAGTATAQSYSPNNPLDMARRDLAKAETDAVRFDPQSPERNTLEGRAQQLRAQIAGSVLIYGAGVKKPGLYSPKPGLTVTEAIKLAGGTTPDVDLGHIAITLPQIRRSNTGAQTVPTVQNISLSIDLNDLAPLPTNHPPDLLPPPRIPENNSWTNFSYNYILASGDSIRIDATEFRFEGGTPKDFLKAIDAHFLTDWQDLANIPPEAAEVKVPKIKTPLQQSVAGVSGSAGEQIRRKPATILLDLYNALAADQPAMGKWKMPEPTGAGARGGGGGGFGFQGSRPPPPHPDLVLAQPTPPAAAKATADQPLRVRSISLVGIPRERWAILERELAELNDSAAALGAKVDPPGAPRRFIGSVQLSPGAGVLLVIGNMEYIELVDTFIGAKRYEAANAKNQ